MKETIRHWLDQNAQAPGLLAWGVRFPDRTCLTQSWSEALPEPRLDETWHSLVETVSVLAQHRVTATRLRWTYEESDLYFAIRSDGICLGLFTAANLDAAAQGAVENLVNDFLAMAGDA